MLNGKRRNKTCPLNARNVCDSCLWQVQLAGKNPQTGQMIDEQACAMVWLPTLLIENSQQQHQTSAAVEAVRDAFHAGFGQVTTAVNQLDLPDGRHGSPEVKRLG